MKIEGMSTPETRAAALFDTLKAKISTLSLGAQMKIVSANSYDKLPPEAQAAMVEIVEELEL